MRKILISSLLAVGMTAAVEAAPTDAATKADLDAIIQRLNKLEAENKAQSKLIGQLETENRQLKAGVSVKKDEVATSEDTSVDGDIYKTRTGHQFFLADKVAGIFQPLTEKGLTFQPYGWFVLEGVHNTHKTAVDMYTDYLYPRKHGGHNGDHQTILSVNDTILGLNVSTPQEINGWNISGTFQFDLAGDDANHTDFHVRHLYFEAAHKSGWSITFGQTWHLWKMVQPNEIDGAWLENTGYPYRRSPQLRVTRKWEDVAGGDLELRAGVVKNGPGMGGDRDGDWNEDNSASAWLLVEGAAIYTHKASWAEKSEKGWLIGVGGQYGRDKSRRDGGVGQSDEYDSKMIMVAGELPIFAGLFNRDEDNPDSLRVVGQLFAGENLGGVQAGVGQRVAFRDPTRRGREVGTIGGFIDIRYDLNKKWAFAVGYGFDDPVDSEAHYANSPEGDGGITFNDRLYGDIFYQILPNMRFAVEYARLKTRYYEEGTASDDRFQFTLGYDF